MIYSAPGKIILAGEHAVVHGYPSIVSTIDVRTQLRCSPRNDASWTISLPNLGKSRGPVSLHDLLAWSKKEFPLLPKVHELLGSPPAPAEGFDIKIESSIPIGAGLGSSATVCVTIAMALMDVFDITMKKGEFLDLCRSAESIYHDNPSGIDTTAAIKGGAFLYKDRKVVEELSRPVVIDGTLFIVNSKIPRNTGEMVRRVARLMEKDEKLVKDRFAKMARVVEEIWGMFRNGRVPVKRLGELMLENHRALADIGVSLPVLDEIVETGMDAGAAGGKLTGAGGGGCVIILAPRDARTRVEDALRERGHEVMKASFPVQGLYAETSGGWDE